MKVLVIGLDGATWDIIKQWVETGKLPNIAKLVKRSKWGILWSTIPPMSPPAWVTLTTGVKPDKHGVFDFYRLENGVLRIVTSRDVRALRVWDILDYYGHRQVIANIPITFPPDPINGVFISGMPTPSTSSEFVYPRSFRRLILDEGYMVETDPNAGISVVRSYTLKGDISGVRKVVNKYNEEVRLKTRVFIRLIEAIKPDFAYLVYTTTDRLQHYIIDYREELLRHYRCIDSAIGELLEQDRFDYVIIVSDHGFSKIKGFFYANSLLLSMRLLQLKSRLALLRSLAMYYGVKVFKWLIRLGLPLDRFISVNRAGSEGNLVLDFEKSKCYMYSHTSCGIVIKASSNEKEKIKTMLVDYINSLWSGKDVIKALKREDVYKGKYASAAPDILLVPGKGYACVSDILPPFLLRKRKYLLEAGRSPHFKTGEHALDGILVIHGPDVEPGRLDARVEDIVPTVLYLLDRPVPSYMDGRVLSISRWRKDIEIMDEKLVARIALRKRLRIRRGIKR